MAMVTGHTREPMQVEAVGTVAADGHDTTPHAVAPAEPTSGPKPWPWLLGGLALGLAIGLAGAGYVTATREFFRAPGWGWAAADIVAESLLRAR
jgi:hypothetical protein